MRIYLLSGIISSISVSTPSFQEDLACSRYQNETKRKQNKKESYMCAVSEMQGAVFSCCFLRGVECILPQIFILKADNICE